MHLLQLLSWQTTGRSLSALLWQHGLHQSGKGQTMPKICFSFSSAGLELIWKAQGTTISKQIVLTLDEHEKEYGLPYTTFLYAKIHRPDWPPQWCTAQKQIQ